MGSPQRLGHRQEQASGLVRLQGSTRGILPNPESHFLPSQCRATAGGWPAGRPHPARQEGSRSPQTLRLVAGARRRRSQPTLLPARRVIALKFASDRGRENGRGGGSAGPRGAAPGAVPSRPLARPARPAAPGRMAARSPARRPPACRSPSAGC